MQAEQLTGPVAHHAEGPVWSDRWGGLRWVDMLAGDVLSLDGNGEVRRRHVGDVAAVTRPRRGGGAVIAVERLAYAGTAAVTVARRGAFPLSIWRQKLSSHGSSVPGGAAADG